MSGVCTAKEIDAVSKGAGQCMWEGCAVRWGWSIAESVEIFI